MFAGWCVETSGQFLRDLFTIGKKTSMAIRVHRIVPIFRPMSSTARASERVHAGFRLEELSSLTSEAAR